MSWSGSYTRYSGWCKNEYCYRIVANVSWTADETSCYYSVSVSGQSVQFNSSYTNVTIYIDGTQVASSSNGKMSSNSTTWQTSGGKTVYRTTSSKSVPITIYMWQPNGSEQVFRDGVSCDASDTLSAITSYTVSYNANGGSGAPSSQTKWYGTNLTLSSTKPTKSGYTFAGWSTSSSATSATYAAGGTYTANASATLYAVWIQNATKCTIAYNANGGSGAPSSQTHTQYTTSTISSTKPTRANYTFLGWSTSSTATTATYLTGGKYTNNSLSNGATVILYAVWKKNYAPMHINVGSSGFKGLYISVPSGKSLTSVYYNA